MARTALSIGLVAIVACAATERASAPTVEDVAEEAETVRPAFDVLEDRSGTLSLAEVISVPLRASFRHVSPGTLNLGYTSSVYWVRLALRHRGSDSLIISLPTTIEGAALFVGNEPVAAARAGKLVPFSQREIRHRSTSFRLRVASGAIAQVHLRLHSNDVMMIAPVVRTEPAFWRAVSAENVAFGAYYGLILSMVVYNLIVFIAIRDSVYLYYVLFQVAFGAMAASFDQLLLEYVWPAHPVWSAHSEVFLGGLTMSSALMFARSFLRAPRTMPRMGRLLKVTAVAAVLLAVAGLATEHRWVGIVARAVATYQCVLVTWAIVRARRAGVRDAAILLIAWITLLGSVLISAISGIGLLPLPLAGPYALKIGSAVEAMLLALGLANRIKEMRRDKERAQVTLLEHRAAQAQLLERTVEERTAELTGTLRNLEAAQDKMITQARMASLGNLIAGIAHEIGNPLNFSAGGAAEVTRRLDALEATVARLGSVIDPGSTAGDQLVIAGQTLASVRKAAQLIDAGNQRIRRLLDALRSQLGGRSVEPQPTDVISELDSVLTLIQGRAQDQHIIIVKDLHPVPPVCGRPGELGQVFMNLLLNSCAALPDGGEIRITCEQKPGVIEMRFSDSGPGIPAEHRQAVFDPFFTTRPPGEGTGLGLAISYDIVRRHNGELTLAHSEPGRGAMFVVRLPL